MRTETRDVTSVRPTVVRFSWHPLCASPHTVHYQISWKFKRRPLCVPAHRPLSNFVKIQSTVRQLLYPYAKEPAYLSLYNHRVTDWKIQEQDFDSRQTQEKFPFSTVPTPAMRPNQPPIQRLPGSFQKEKGRRHKNDNPPPPPFRDYECVEL